MQFKLPIKPIFSAFLVILILFFSTSTSAEHTCSKNPKKQRSVSRKIKSEKNGEKSATTQHNNLSSLLSKIESEHTNYELKRIETLFSHVDKLFKNMNVEYRSLLHDQTLGPEAYSDLHTFLSGPHGLSNILPLIKDELHQDFEQLIATKFKGEYSLLNIIKFLWKQHKITAEQSQHILAKNSLLSSQEIIKLVENGIVKSSKGVLVKLRTGSCYGDPLLLFNKLENILLTSKNRNTLDDINLPLDELLLLEFNKHQIDAEKAVIDGKIIDQLRKHFLFISNLGIPIRFKSQTVSFAAGGPPSSVAVNSINSFNATITPSTLSALMIGNHYFSTFNTSASASLFVNPLGLNFSGSYTWTNDALSARGLDWWVYYTDSYLGIGGDYTINFDQGTFWSNGQASLLTIGGMLGGWKNYLQAGISLQTLLANSIGAGASAVFTIEREHTVAYLERYPIDGKFAALRGLHKIEINDSKRVNQTASVAVNFWATEVPISVAFRAGVEHTTNSIFRTHVELEQAQGMLSEADIPGILLILGKKIKETKFPGFAHPESLKVGDELVEKKIGMLSGAFVTGLEAFVPIAPLRVGVNLEVSGEFELGLMRLPNNKFQVSVEPTYVAEIGFFSTMMNVLVAGSLHGISLAKKQIFLFDFNNETAKEAYFTMIETGELPNFFEIEVSYSERGPENLLTDFRAQNNYLREQGIELTYLEQNRIGSNKAHIGLMTPIVPAFLAVLNKADKLARPRKDRFNLSFEGIDRQIMSAHATSIATNGIIAVKRRSYGGKVSEGQGLSGRYNKELYVTHRRVYSSDDLLNETSKSRFDSLLVHAIIEDTKITGNEENRLLQPINKLFSAHIEEFSQKNSKSPRVINLEREFNRKDLFILSTMKDDHHRTYLINKAHRATGISHERIRILLEELRDKHPDKQGLMLKQFIETADGLAGFAALHQLLEAKPEDLLIHVESGYMSVVNEAKTFILLNTHPDHDSDNVKVRFTTLKKRKNKKRIRSFYDGARNILRRIDWQLRQVQLDNYLLSKESALATRIGKERYESLIENGIRQEKLAFTTALLSARKQIIALMDLNGQNFTDDERLIIYQMAQKKRLRILDNADWLYLKYRSSPCKGKNKIHAMLGLINDRIASLSIDETMKEIDLDYIENYSSALQALHEKLEHLVNSCIPEDTEEATHSHKKPLSFRRSRSLLHPQEFSLKSVLSARKSNVHHEL